MTAIVAVVVFCAAVAAVDNAATALRLRRERRWLARTMIARHIDGPYR